MPAVGAAISAIAASPIGSFVARTVIVAASSLALNYLTRKRTSQQAARSGTGGVSGKLTGGGIVPLSFIFGEWATAGTLIYANTSVSTSGSENVVLSMVIELQSIPGAFLTGIIVDGVNRSFEDPIGEGDLLGLSGFRPITQYRGGESAPYSYMYVKFYDGSQTEADPWMVSNFSGDGAHPYGTTRIGTGLVYAVVIAVRHKELFGSGFPQIKFIFGGPKWYDIRNDSSMGGDGAERFDDQTTWTGDGNNAMMMAYNVLRGVYYDGQRVWGGECVAAQLPFDDWAAAINECDKSTARGDGESERQYGCGGEITVDQQPLDVLDELMRACNGHIAEIGGIYKPRVGAAGPAVFSFLDEDIRTDDSNVLKPFSGIEETINGATGRSISREDGWAWKDLAPRYDEDLRAEDGGFRLHKNVSYGYVQSDPQAQRLLQSAINEARRFRRHTLPLGPSAWVLEPNDIVSWTSTTNGYEGKLFTVLAVQDLPNGHVLVDLWEVDPDDYDWTPATDEKPISTSMPTSYRPSAQAIQDFNVVGASTTHNGRQIPGALFTWSAPDVDVTDVLFKVWLASQDPDTDQPILETQSPFPETGEFFTSQNLGRDTDYVGKARFYSDSGRPFEWTNAIAFHTPDVNPWVVTEIDLDEFREELNEVVENARSQVDLSELTLAQLLNTTASVAETVQRQRIEYSVQRGAFEARVVKEQIARVTSDSALAADITGVSASLSALSGDVSGNSAAVSALQADVTAIDGIVTTHTSQITSMSSSLTSLSGDVSGNSAAISALESSVTSQGGTISAVSSAVAQVNAGVGGNYAQARVAFLTAANQTGADARFAWEIRASSGNSFVECGIYAEVGSFGSRIAIVASQLSVVSVVNGTRYFPLTIVGSKIRLTGDVEIDGTLNLMNATVITNKLAAGAINDVDYDDNGSENISTSDVTLLEVTVNADTAGIVQFLQFYKLTNVDMSGLDQLQLTLRNETTNNIVWQVLALFSSFTSGEVVPAQSEDSSPAQGNNTYTFKAVTTAHTCNMSLNNISAMSKKR